MSYFPIFIDLKDRLFLIVGGGTVAYHKAKVLLDFEAKIKVIAPDIKNEIKEEKMISYEERIFMERDLSDVEFVVIATNDKELNHEIAKLCEERKLMYNTIDQLMDCKFIFPSYIKEKDLVVGISSSGKSPVITRYIKEKIKEILTEDIAKMADVLGEIRPRIKNEIREEKNRKKIYQGLFDLFLKEKKLPDDRDIEKEITYMKNLELQERKLDDM